MLTVVLAATPLVLVFVVKPYRIPSPSMEPTIRCARPATGCTGSSTDRVLVLRYVFGDPGRGDIVAFHASGRVGRLCGTGGTFLKRVIGLPGELVSERRGVFSVNGRPLAEPYVSAEGADDESNHWDRLPSGSYFVVGDNRRLSCDSRVFGAVSRDDVIGRVVAIYWPPGRLSRP